MSKTEEKLEIICVHMGLNIVGFLKCEDKEGIKKAEVLVFQITKLVPEKYA